MVGRILLKLAMLFFDYMLFISSWAKYPFNPYSQVIRVQMIIVRHDRQKSLTIYCWTQVSPYIGRFWLCNPRCPEELVRECFKFSCSLHWCLPVLFCSLSLLVHWVGMELQQLIAVRHLSFTAIGTSSQIDVFLRFNMNIMIIIANVNVNPKF